MSEKATATSSSGIGFFGLLTIVLVVLKATGYIDWSWWLVFSPILVGIGMGLLVLAFVVTIWLIVALKS